ncbi:MAG: OmpA family protein [Bacteroidales bacterium]
MNFRSSLVLVLFTLVIPCQAQISYSSSSKKAVRFLEEGLKAYQDRDYKLAISNLGEALKADPAFYEAGFLLGDIYIETGDKHKAIEVYQKSLALKPDVFAGGWYNLGEALMIECRYQEAYEAYGKYLSFKSNPAIKIREAEKQFRDCAFALTALKSPVPFNPVNLGDSVNTSLNEYWPSLSADENILAFTRLLLKNPEKPFAPGNLQEDLFYSERNGKGWSPAQNYGYRLNSAGNEGAQSLSADGKAMFFTACNRDDGMGMCDIYVSVLTRDGWSLPENLGAPVNTSASEKQPCISADGKTLYFVSNRPGTLGGLDIWASTLNEQGTWETPVNLGDSVNTDWDEESPFIHQDNLTLYFSSKGWPGMGGFDIFRTTSGGNNSWSHAINLGYPINTCRDENGLIVNTRGFTAYYGSNRDPKQGMDIFSFDLYKDARPVPSSYLKGRVTDADNQKPLEASCKLIDLATGKVWNNVTSNAGNGEFLVTLPSERDYALNVSRDGYLFYSENFSLSEVFEAVNPFFLNIPLKPVKIGEKVILRNIFFEVNSATLKSASLVELKKTLEFLNKNPLISIEISGHTDNTGTDEFNRKLSENRAAVVAGYLLENGITKDRISSKGYGSSMPVADNSTEEGRAKNRRTEFKITGRK